MGRAKEYMLEQQTMRYKGKLGFGKYDPAPVDFRESTEDEQVEMMLHWFLDRFCDPAENTPYSSEEGGYMFIWGGPFNPNEEITERFDGIASESAIKRTIDKLLRDVGHEWAPIEHLGYEEYDEDFDVPDAAIDESHKNLKMHLDNLRNLLQVNKDKDYDSVVRPLVFAAAIGAMESYLYEIASNLVRDSTEFQKNLIVKSAVLKGQSFSISDIYKIHDNIDKRIIGHFQNFVWHRWAEVEVIFNAGLEIDIKLHDKLQPSTLLRHDITHRSGRTKDGEPIEITYMSAMELIATIENIANDLNAQIAGAGMPA
jgi:hypothetical protein